MVYFQWTLSIIIIIIIIIIVIISLLKYLTEYLRCEIVYL